MSHHSFNPITQTPFISKGGESHDSDYFESVDLYLQKHSFSAHEALEYWPILTRRTSLQRFLALNELFKITLDVPGDIAEFGVWQGHSLLTWANLLEIYATTDRSKEVFGFDTFAGFTSFAKEDGTTGDVQQRKTLDSFGGESVYRKLLDAIELYDMDRFVSWKNRISLIVGDVMETLPKWLSDNQGRRFSLVYLDLDVYEPTKFVMDQLWSHMPNGAVLAFDEYAKPAWQGESQAVDEFLQENGLKETLKKFPWNSTPGAYLIKGH